MRLPTKPKRSRSSAPFWSVCPAPGFNADQAADERTMDELRALAETAGAEAVAMTLQRRPAPDARTFIGEGKAEEVKALAEANDASLILFDNELSPSQMSNLEELTGRTVLDRSALILDIFAQRARRARANYGSSWRSISISCPVWPAWARR